MDKDSMIQGFNLIDKLGVGNHYYNGTYMVYLRTIFQYPQVIRPILLYSLAFII